jgi:hypothetical protein
MKEWKNGQNFLSLSEQISKKPVFRQLWTVTFCYVRKKDLQIVRPYTFLTEET